MKLLPIFPFYTSSPFWFVRTLFDYFGHLLFKIQFPDLSRTNPLMQKHPGSHKLEQSLGSLGSSVQAGSQPNTRHPEKAMFAGPVRNDLDIVIQLLLITNVYSTYKH